MTFGSVFGRVLSPTFQPSSQAAAAAGGWWLSGGTAGINYKVACKITTSAGRTDERTIWIKVMDR